MRQHAAPALAARPGFEANPASAQVFVSSFDGACRDRHSHELPHEDASIEVALIDLLDHQVRPAFREPEFGNTLFIRAPDYFEAECLGVKAHGLLPGFDEDHDVANSAKHGYPLVPEGERPRSVAGPASNDFQPWESFLPRWVNSHGLPGFPRPTCGPGRGRT